MKLPKLKINKKSLAITISISIIYITICAIFGNQIVDFFRNIPLNLPAKNFILVVILGLLLGILHTMKNRKQDDREWRERHEKTISLIEWFALIVLPLQLAIEAITSNGISLYWIYFPLVISSAIWIGIGVQKGGYPLRNWSSQYAKTFIFCCLVLFSAGIGLHIMLDFEYQYEPHRLFPWIKQ